MQGANKKGSAIGVINMGSTGILGILGISLNNIGHGFIRIAKNRYLQKDSLIQLQDDQMIHYLWLGHFLPNWPDEERLRVEQSSEYYELCQIS